jgi:hypothetical protein
MIMSRGFGDNKAICMSLLDAMALFMNAPHFGHTIGQIVPTLGLWAAVTMVATLFVLASTIMMKATLPVLKKHAALC